jgi:uncharacterized membrane protein (UPF0136 family)
MARRKASGRSTFSNLRVKDVLPIWTSANSNLNTAMFVSYLQGLGITGIPSYLRKLAIHSGVSGMFVGALLGLATPAALIWLVITLIHMAIYLIAFCAAWVVIFYVVRWLFSSGF